MICNICGQGFKPNPEIHLQMSRHEEWHRHCKINKRNTVEGEVKWLDE